MLKSHDIQAMFHADNYKGWKDRIPYIEFYSFPYFVWIYEDLIVRIPALVYRVEPHLCILR